jgi:hypothetical protein
MRFAASLIVFLSDENIPVAYPVPAVLPIPISVFFL